MNEFTFTTADCIEVRKQVLKCYCSMCGAQTTIPNVVKADAPWEDVVSDFQMMIYCYLFKEGMREVERAYQTGTIYKQAKQQYTRVKNMAQRIDRHIPFGNTEFVSQYADIDEALSERIDKIVTLTYYPLLNNALKECPGLRSDVAQAIAHLITGMCFVIMACEKGMIRNHHVPCEACHDLGDCICRLAAVTSLVNQAGVEFDETKMESTVTATMNMVINLSEKTMMEIMERAKSIDLLDYVRAADYTKERFEYLIKTDERMRTKAMLRSMRKSFVRTGGTR